MENFIFCAVNPAGFCFTKPDNPLLPCKKCYSIYFEMCELLIQIGSIITNWGISEAYLEPIRTSTMELFYENI